jgi:hypothetical protein
VRAPRVIATASLPGRTWPCTRGAAVRSSQAQVHVTNFDYNHDPLNTMPDTRPDQARSRRRPGAGQLSPPARTASGHPGEEAATQATRRAA